MKFNYVVFMLLILLAPIVFAQMQNLGTFNAGEEVNLIQTCDSCTYNNITRILYPNSTEANSEEIAMIKSGTHYSYIFNDTSTVGTYVVTGHGDLEGEDTVWIYDFETIGTEGGTSIGANIILLIFFSLLLFSAVMLNRSINYEKWYKGILNKYENKSYVKYVLALVGYNLMKNTFIIYYFLGFPIMIMLTSIVYIYNVTSMITLIETLMYVYTWAILLVGLVVLGNLQEFIKTLTNDIKNMEWGFDKWKTMEPQLD